MKNLLKVSLITLLGISTLFANNTIKIIPPQSKFDSSHKYFQELLQKILDITEDEYGKSKIKYSKKMEQGRAFVELKNRKKVDILWAGTSIEREKNFKAIKIPLLKGLLGYRVFIIRKDNINTFNSINSLEELKKLKACQGAHWPDTDILEYANIKVVKNTNYEAMFLQVLSNRCDYFPRGIHEAYSEMKIRKNKYSELMLFDDIILYYPFPMYFFTAKENEKLAKRVKKGLLSLIKNNEFTTNIEKSKITKHLFPIKNWINKTTYKIDNPLLSKDTNIQNKELWITK